MDVTISTTYPTQGSNAFEWGEPEERLTAVLEERGIEIVTYDAGTMLSTGERDVWMVVEVLSIDPVLQAVEMLPSSERDIWKVEAIR